MVVNGGRTGNRMFIVPVNFMRRVYRVEYDSVSLKSYSLSYANRDDYIICDSVQFGIWMWRCLAEKFILHFGIRIFSRGIVKNFLIF